MALPDFSPLADRADIVSLPNAALRLCGLQTFVALDIFDEPEFYWSGFGDINMAGQNWQGVGNVIDIGQIPMGVAQMAAAVTLRIQGEGHSEGVASLMAKISAEPDGVEGREIAILGGLFDPASYVGTGALTDLFFLFRSKQGGRVKMKSSASNSGVSHEVSLTAESWFSGVRDVVHQNVTDSAIKARTPGDRGGEHVGQLAGGKSVIWRRG